MEHTAVSSWLLWIPLLPLVGAAFNLLFGRKLGRGVVHLVGCGSVAAALIVGLIAICTELYPLWKLATAGGHGHFGPAPALSANLLGWLSQGAAWIQAGDVSIKLGLSLDPLSAVMVFTITFVGFLIHVYSMGYMAHDPGYARFFGYLNLFTGAMLLLVLGDNLIVLFVGWEGVGLCSYLLIGFWYDKDGTEKPGDANASAGRKAFIVNRVGDFAFLLGLFLIFSVAGTLNIGELQDKTGALMTIFNPLAWLGGKAAVSVAAVASLLLLIGATGKSAQIPLFVWLPDAMAGPTPVSALIHAATMVTAGVYMVARLNFLFMLSPTVMGVVALVGAATALFAATIGFAQTDIKKVLAYSTISQLGYMFIGVGVGAFAGGVFHLFTHAFFKACLFLGAGSVIHAMSGKQDIRQMGGLREKLPLTHWTFAISCVAIAGIFPLSGFFSKDEILWRALSMHNPGWPTWLPALIYGLALAGALCTAFYMFRLYYLTFHGECRADEETKHHIHESPLRMTMPLVVLATGAALLGALGLPGVTTLPNLFEQWLAPVVDRGAQLAATVRGIQPVGRNALAESHGAEWGLMVVSLVVALIGIFVARSLYKDGIAASVERLVGSFPRLYRLVRDKYRIDELYHLFIVRPVQLLALVLWRAVDAVIIDLCAVNILGGWLPDAVGRISRRLQNGNVQRYLVGFAGGVALVVLVSSCPPDRFNAISSEEIVAGKTVTLRAEQPADNADKRSLRYRWTFGDNTKMTDWDESPVVSHAFTRPGRYTVKLEVQDRSWQTSASRTHTLVVR
jgi:NADH-quinone oxidoreductase subunit L